MMIDKDDNLLMEQVKQGDKIAYEELVARHYKAGVVFAYQIVSDYHMAEDIVQECYAKIYLMRNRYKANYAFKTYLFTIIRNQSIDYIRKQKNRMPVSYDESCSDGKMLAAEEILVADEEKRELYSYIGSLKEDQKQLLYLYAMEGLNYKEIARISGQSVGQVKIKLFRCRQTLKSKMEDRKQNGR